MAKLQQKHDPKTGKFEAEGKPKMRQITSKMAEEEALQIASYAANYGLSTSEFVRRAMLEKIAHVPMLEGR